MTENKHPETDKETALYDDLEKRISISERKLHPDALAKAIDQSYLSINNLRVFLQILSLIFTVFLAGIGFMAWFGFSNLEEIRKRSDDVDALHKNMQSLYSSAQEIQSSASTIISDMQTQTVQGLNDFKKKQAEALKEIGANISSAQESIRDQQSVLEEQRNATENTRDLLTTTMKDLADQASRMKSMEAELSALISSSTNEIFYGSQSNRVYFYQKKDGATVVIFRLEKRPLSQTISGTYNNFAFSPGALKILFNNFVYAAISTGKDTAKGIAYVVGYTPDPNTDINDYPAEITENGITINGQPISLE